MIILSVQALSALAAFGLIAYLAFLYRRYPRRATRRLALIVAALGLMALSFFLHRIHLQGDEGGVALFRAAAAVNGVGSLLFFLFAPPAYRFILGIPAAKAARYGQAILATLILLLALGLAWQRHRGIAVTLLHQLFVLSTIYTGGFCLYHLRDLAEPGVRLSALIQGIASLVLIPPFYIEVSVNALGPFIHSHPADALALPVYVTLFAAGGGVFARRRLGRPPWLVDGAVTSAFRESFGLSEAEAALASRTVRAGRIQWRGGTDNEEDAPVRELCSKLNCRNRKELVNLLLANR
ncbi:MAG: hypothetical protein ACOC28_04165 [Alkalispirochaetaceae bacterium]